jgi:hypothetical protein
MNRFDFCKELYFKESDKKNEINNSLSLPIGVITGFVVAFFYLLTTFDFECNLFQTLFFSLLGVASIIYLAASIYHLIKAYSNFHNGYDYLYLADSLELENFYKELKKYFKDNPTLTDTSEEDFENFIVDEMIKDTDTNQKNNKKKNWHRYVCEKHLITAFILLSITLIPFGFNYAYKKDKQATVSVDLQSRNNANFIDSLLSKHINMNNNNPPPKPTGPPSQVIKEGQDPQIRPQTQNPPPPKPDKK